MEPAKKSLKIAYTFHTTVEEVDHTYNKLLLFGIGSAFYVKTNLSPGDRVKITIEKESDDIPR